MTGHRELRVGQVADDDTTDSHPSEALSHHERQQFADASGGTPRVVHEVIRLQGDEELDRPVLSLAYSGVAAGAALSASVFAQAAILMRLPNEPWSQLVGGFGYSIGFVIVVMGRLQLFTENTITAVLPFINNPTLNNATRLARLWAVVLVANLVGTAVVGLGVASATIVEADLRSQILLMGKHLLEPSPTTVLVHGIPAGFLIAALAWVLPSAKGSEFWVITAITYLIAIGGFTHVIASSSEIWAAIFVGQASVVDGMTGFILPALAGNIIGGTVLFAVLAHGQVKGEL